MTRVKPASGIGNASAVAGGGASHIGGASAVPKPPKRMTAAEENALRKPPASALGPGNGPALPSDSIAEGKIANAQSGNVATHQQIASNRALGLAEFGLDPGYNDPKANPYSQAAVLQHNHESNQRGILTTAGQAIYSGQTGNAQLGDQGRFNQGHQELVNTENRAKANWEAEEKAADQAEKEAIWAAKEGAVERATQAPGPEVPLPGGGGGGKERIPYPAPANKKWAWNGSHWHLVKA
jgi:hypothetical protein